MTGKQQATREPTDFRSPFPSDEHRKHLRQRAIDGHYGTFSDEDLWFYHAYDYAWRRAFLQTKEDVSPIDPGQKWFDARLVEKAQSIFRKRHAAVSDAARYREADEARQEFARERGFADFSAVIAYGINRAGQMKPQSQQEPPPRIEEMED